MSLKLVVALFFVSYVSTDFVCPRTAIALNGGVQGVIPNGATKNNIVPVNTNCTFWFTVPRGYALRILITSTYDPTQKDDLIFTDSAKFGYRVTSPANEAAEWAPSPEASLQVVGATGKSTFYAEYTYVDLSGYTQTKLSTGSYLPLSFSKNYYYTWTSQKNDKVVFTPAKVNNVAVDPVIDNVYAFDGPDITESSFLGRLSAIATTYKMHASSSSSLTLVNFYQTVSSSYVIANDASAISQYSKYLAVLTSSNTITSGNLSDTTTQGAGYTFICTDCDNIYLTELLFSFALNTGYAQFSGMSPTHALSAPITYQAQTFVNTKLPQVIPTRMFTLKLYMSTIRIAINTVGSSWQKAYDNREVVIFNPMVWNPTSQQNSFDYTFKSDVLMKYNVSLDQLSFKGTDTLRLTIGDGTTSNVDNTYPKTTTSTGVVVGNGKQVSLKYQNGVAASNIKVSIKMNVSQSSMFLGTILATMFPVFLSLSS